MICGGLPIAGSFVKLADTSFHIIFERFLSTRDPAFTSNSIHESQPSNLQILKMSTDLKVQTWDLGRIACETNDITLLDEAIRSVAAADMNLFHGHLLEKSAGAACSTAN